MQLRYLAAAAALTALLVTAAGGIAVGWKGETENQKLCAKVGAAVDEYLRASGDVKASMTRQEVALAAVRLMGKEAEAEADKTVSGRIDLILGLTGLLGGEAKLMLSHQADGRLSVDPFTVPSGTEIRLNGKAAAMSDLAIGDAVKLTIVSGMVTRIEATR